ncbi:XRE family transcriptional regulator [Pseudonocardiaceae bacterium YIM PH 21723]|nr:XRE family transcriptional regulator [Pseudonocardiaceae bacterium YIM PH 21723]
MIGTYSGTVAQQPSGPSVRRRRLGAELRRIRESAGRQMKEAASLLGCSMGKISNIEQGRYGVKKQELQALLSYYEVEPEVCAVLEDLRREGAKRGWWSVYGLPDWFKPYVGLESDAASVRSFELELIPGLLQTEAYARQVHVAVTRMVAPQDVERQVTARMERQRRLTGPEPLELWAVISEAAVRRQVGGPEVMIEQLEHLRTLAAQPNIKIQVLPFSAGAHGSMSGPFSILSFPEPTDPDVAYIEYPVGGNCVEEPRDVHRFTILFDDLRYAALSSRDTDTLFGAIVKELSTS